MLWMANAEEEWLDGDSRIGGDPAPLLPFRVGLRLTE